MSDQQYILRSIAEAACEKLMQEIDKSQAENARLKAEVERLRKAGDALYNRYLCSGCSVCEGMYDDPKVLDEWNAAKEGKQP